MDVVRVLTMYVCTYICACALYLSKGIYIYVFRMRIEWIFPRRFIWWEFYFQRTHKLFKLRVGIVNLPANLHSIHYIGIILYTYNWNVTIKWTYRMEMYIYITIFVFGETNWFGKTKSWGQKILLCISWRTKRDKSNNKTKTTGWTRCTLKSRLPNYTYILLSIWNCIQIWTVENVEPFPQWNQMNWKTQIENDRPEVLKYWAGIEPVIPQLMALYCHIFVYLCI